VLSNGGYSYFTIPRELYIVSTIVDLEHRVIWKIEGKPSKK
jgi:hypothetical protein